jgi:hypothetical protein
MVHQFRTFFFILYMIGLGLALAGCGPGGSAADIEPISSLEAQAARSAETTTEPVPTPTDLPVEIADPISPVSPVPPPGEETQMVPGIQEVEPLPGSEAALAAATADLVERTGLPAAEIKLVSMEEQQWSDASLGCPQEGYMYAQVITPGYLITLEAQGQTYAYHTDQQANIVLCPPE